MNAIAGEHIPSIDNGHVGTIVPIRARGTVAVRRYIHSGVP